MVAQLYEFLRDLGSFQLTTHPWNVVFDLLAQYGSLSPSHHIHIAGNGMEEEGKKKGAKGTCQCIEGRLSEESWQVTLFITYWLELGL